MVKMFANWLIPNERANHIVGSGPFSMLSWSDFSILQNSGYPKQLYTAAAAIINSAKPFASYYFSCPNDRFLASISIFGYILQ